MAQCRVASAPLNLTGAPRCPLASLGLDSRSLRTIRERLLWAFRRSVGARGKLSDAIGYVASGHTFAEAEGEFLEGA